MCTRWVRHARNSVTATVEHEGVRKLCQKNVSTEQAGLYVHAYLAAVVDGLVAPVVGRNFGAEDLVGSLVVEGRRMHTGLAEVGSAGTRYTGVVVVVRRTRCKEVGGKVFRTALVVC